MELNCVFEMGHQRVIIERMKKGECKDGGMIKRQSDCRCCKAKTEMEYAGYGALVETETEMFQVSFSPELWECERQVATEKQIA